MIVVLDACVLYPASLRDLLLTLAALDAFEPRWSIAILDEMTRNVLADHPDIDPARFVQHTVGSMQKAFPDASIHVPAELIDSLDNDPKDRHVAAAAVQTGAHAIITDNINDFNSTVLQRAQIDVLTPGELVGRLLDDTPEIVTTAIDHIAARWQHPRRTFAEIVELLAAHPSMKATIRRLS